MNMRIAWVAGTAMLVSSAALLAQGNGLDIEEETPISLVGCIQRETEYRRQNDSGKGGFLGFGGGLGDEYVLVNASRGFPGVDGDCTTATGGDAYELKGSEEEELEAFVGQRVAITGMLDEADVDPATGRPTGGRQAGDDLKLFEVDVESVRPLVLARAQAPVNPIPDRDRAIEIDRRDLGDREQLPRTASPLAVTGLFGLLSLGGLAGLRTMYRRDRRRFR